MTGLKDKKLTQLRRDRIGFIFQAFNLLPTPERHREHHAPDGHRGPQAGRRVAAPGRRDGRPRRARLKHRPTQLSGGQQQRVAVALRAGRPPRDHLR
ncbi:ATP-binding cassette domain-containing protein [Streptomyces sp. KL116D]|uniref:ATP-binding cassette domain-containing protein n=1 Tax=Streptomyces sp. KL116D TaxID=3045152 RepID=UPI0035576C1A